jgi:hypothetical protein
VQIVLQYSANFTQYAIQNAESQIMLGRNDQFIFLLQIVKDFCQWVENLGGMEKSQMTEDTVQQLFEIGFNAPAARALCVRCQELPVVTESAVQARNLPKVCVIIRPSSSDHTLAVASHLIFLCSFICLCISCCAGRGSRVV